MTKFKEYGTMGLVLLIVVCADGIVELLAGSLM